MTNPEHQDPVGSIVLVSQIIVGALVFGVIPLLVIAFLIGPLFASPQPGAPGGPASTLLINTILEYSAISAATLALLLSFILPRALSSVDRKSPAPGTFDAQLGVGPTKGARLQSADEQRAALLPRYQQQLIVRAAILEGAAFFAATVYLLTGNPILAGVAILLLVAMLAFFPTRARVDLWLEQHQQKLRDDEFARSSV